MRTGRKRQVLVVDDVSSRRELIQSQLINSGYDVYFAENGEKVILFLQMEDVDLVVINCEMSDMSKEGMVKWILTYRPTSVLFMRVEYRTDARIVASEICRLLPIGLRPDATKSGF